MREHGRGDFFRIVRLFDQALTDKAPIGGVGPVDDERIQFRHDHSLAFSTSDVTAIRVSGEDPAPTAAVVGSSGASRPTLPSVVITSSFLGLTGTVTPLPPHIAEAVEQESLQRPILRDLFDLLHHRLLALFYRAVSRLSLPDEFERGCLDRWSRWILATRDIDIDLQPEPEIQQAAPRREGGAKTDADDTDFDADFDADDGASASASATISGRESTNESSALEPWQLLRLLPLLSFPTCSRWVLEAALADVLSEHLDGASINIETFIGEWTPIETSKQMRLGVANSELGINTVVGQSIFDQAAKIRIAIGPLPYTAYQRFRSDKRLARLVAETVSLFRKEYLSCDMALRLSPEAVPGFRLNSTTPCRLGVDTFLGGSPVTDVIVPVPGPLVD